MQLLNHSTDAVLDPESYLEQVERIADPHDEDSLLEAARLLQALANNKALLIGAVNRTLKRLAERSVVTASSATIMLGRAHTKPWFLRANLWPPLRDAASAAERMTFSYEGVHDHNFSFITANYFGPGYETEVWLNRQPTEDGFNAGDAVELDYQGRFLLGPSTQMIYRHGRDVHLQLPPSDFTVSLNLMFNEPEVRLRPQHNYDPRAGRVVGFPTGTMSTRRTELIRMAERIGDATTVSRLDELAGRTPCRHTREASRLGAQALRDRLSGARTEAVR